MKRFVICYSRWGLELGGKTKEELIDAYLKSVGGLQNAVDHFIKHMTFIEDTSKVVKPKK